MEHCKGQKISPDEEIVAHYLMKIFGIQFGDLEKYDLMCLMLFYMEELKLEIMPRQNFCPGEEVKAQDRSLGIAMSEHLTERAEAYKKSVANNMLSSLVVCYCCKKRGTHSPWL